jgi:uncharacterized protein (DUF433 family)
MDERIEINSRVRGGEPVFRGTRIPVSTIVRKLERGASRSELLEDYPKLSHADLDLAEAMMGAAKSDAMRLEADPDPAVITEILNAIPGACERHQKGCDDARRGRTIPLEDL